MIVGDTCLVVSTDCCEGHPIGTIVRVIKVLEPGAFPDEDASYEVEPIKNHILNCTMYQCSNCLRKIKILPEQN